MISAKIDNKKLLSALKLFPDNIQRNVMVGATRAGANVLVKEIKANVPVKSGATKKSIGIIRRRTFKNEVIFSVTPRKGGKNSGWKMRFIEFGTSKQVAKPVFRKAFESQSDESLTAAKKHIQVRLPKELAKAKR